MNRAGFSGGTLREAVTDMGEKLGPMKADEVVPAYRDFIDIFSRHAGKILSETGFDGIFAVEVRALPDTEKKSGSFEYEGGGRAVTSIRPSVSRVRPRIIYVTAHEMTHLLESVLREKYYNDTGDLFGAVGTMCTATSALDEGVSELCMGIYGDAITEAAGSQAPVMPLIDGLQKMKMAAVEYTGDLAQRQQSEKDFGREALFSDLVAIHLRYGMDEDSARVAAEGLLDPNRDHKNWFYTPFYHRAYLSALGALGGLEQDFMKGFRDYAARTLKNGPLTLRTA